MNRQAKRQMNEANEYLSSLIALYVRYKNKHSYTHQGKVCIPAHINEYRLQLESMWRRYCAVNNASKKAVIRLREEAFMERFQQNVDNHRRMAWFAKVREIYDLKFGFIPNMIMAMNTYDMFSDPEEGAIYCCKNIPLNAHI